MLTMQRAVEGYRAIYLVPFKAIAEERHAEFTARYKANASLGFRCIVSDRDHHEYDADLLNGTYDVAILTYEKFTALLVANQNLLSACSAVVVDEVQMISDINRGPGLELLLTKLRQLRENCQILALSAVLGELNGFDSWLGATLVREQNRPVELRMGIVGPLGHFEYREANTARTGVEIVQDPSLIGIVRELTQRGEQVLIFQNSIRTVNEQALALASALHLPAAADAIRQLSDEADTDTRDILLKTLRTGIAIHHADCELPERLIVESAFRARDVRIIVSTTTLSMGVNLPVDNVVLGATQKWTKIAGQFTSSPWRVAEVRNMLGRAGRLGRTSTFGRGIIVASTPAEKIQIQRRYLDSDLEPLSSALAETDVEARVLAVVATGYAASELEVEDFLFDTFAGRNWAAVRSQIKQLIANGINRCKQLELIENSAANLHPTKLGRIAAANNLSLDSFRSLKEYVAEAVVFDPLDATFVAAKASEMKESVQRINWDDPARMISIRTIMNSHHEKNRLVGTIQRIFSFLSENPNTTHDAELTIAAVCEEVLGTERPMRELCREFKISGPNLRQICEGVSWMAEVMASIASAIRPELRLELQELADCLKQRAPFSCRLLRELPANVSRDERIKLKTRGIEKTEQFLELSPSDLNGIMSPNKADRILRSLNDQRERNYAYWRRDHKRRLDALGYKTDLVDRVYETKDRELESAIADLLNIGFSKLNAQKITDQNKGEPDLLLLFNSGAKISVQITAKESNTKYVDSKKAGDVIPQSARFHVDGYMCIGRPDFETLAKEQAGHLAQKFNYKQLPLSVLVELFVRMKEARVSSDEAHEFILNRRGFLSLTTLPGSTPVSM